MVQKAPSTRSQNLRFQAAVSSRNAAPRAQNALNACSPVRAANRRKLLHGFRWLRWTEGMCQRGLLMIQIELSNFKKTTFPICCTRDISKEGSHLRTLEGSEFQVELSRPQQPEQKREPGRSTTRAVGYDEYQTIIQFKLIPITTHSIYVQKNKT